MATKKTKVSNEVLDAYNEERLVSKYDKGAKWPKVIRGSHSTRTEYADGRVEFETHWDELKRDVEAALASVAKPPKEKPAVKTPKKVVKEVVAEKPKKKTAKKEVVKAEPKKATKKKTK